MHGRGDTGQPTPVCTSYALYSTLYVQVLYVYEYFLSPRKNILKSVRRFTLSLTPSMINLLN